MRRPNADGLRAACHCDSGELDLRLARSRSTGLLMIATRGGRSYTRCSTNVGLHEAAPLPNWEAGLTRTTGHPENSTCT